MITRVKRPRSIMVKGSDRLTIEDDAGIYGFIKTNNMGGQQQNKCIIGDTEINFSEFLKLVTLNKE